MVTRRALPWCTGQHQSLSSFGAGFESQWEHVVSSPCTRDCAVEDGECLSCNRTMEEILSWGEMIEEERLAIMDELEER